MTNRSQKALRVPFPAFTVPPTPAGQVVVEPVHEVGRSLMRAALAGLAEGLDPAATCVGPDGLADVSGKARRPRASPAT
jgi:hypothetical protein